MPMCEYVGEGQCPNPWHQWNPEPIFFTRRGTEILASGWPDQIEIARSLLAVVDPKVIREDDGVITICVDNGRQRYRIVGDRGDDVLECVRLTL